MTIKIVTSVHTLMIHARELGAARTSKDERIAKAQAAHDAYRDACLASDEMMTGFTWGSLSS